MKIKIQAGKRKIKVIFPNGTTTTGAFNKDGLKCASWKNKEGQGGEETFEAKDTLNKVYQWLDIYNSLPVKLNVDVNKEHIRATFPNGSSFIAIFNENGLKHAMIQVNSGVLTEREDPFEGKTKRLLQATGVAPASEESIDALDNLHGWVMFPE